VGFAVNLLSVAIEPQTGGTERILILRLSTTTGFVNLISIHVYASTLCSIHVAKDQFCEELDEAIPRIHNTELEGLYLL
jgi:hypothetical protein